MAADKEVLLRSFDGCTDQRRASFELATSNPHTHMNLYILSCRGDHANICMCPDDAKIMRDRLVEAYPYDKQAAEESLVVGSRTILIKPSGEVIVSIPVLFEEVED